MYYHHDDGSDEETVRYAKNVLFWTVVILAIIFAVLVCLAPSDGAQKKRTTIIGGCDDSLWKHVYNPSRLQVHRLCADVTGVVIDATHGKRKDGVRHEADGDCHGWLKLDKGQEDFLNKGNLSDEGGNLVFEIVCLYKVTQADAKSACAGYKNSIKLPAVGSHVRITGSWVQDDNHAHWNEIHPVSSIEVLK